MNDEVFSLFGAYKKIFLKSAGLPYIRNVYLYGREGSIIQEVDWIKTVQNGGPENFRPFVQEYGPYIYRTVYAVLRSPHDAEDVTQEVLLQIYRSLPECRFDGLKTWITRIAVNRAIDHKRSRARKPEQLVDEVSFEEKPPDQAQTMSMPAAEQLTIEAEDKRLVQERIASMPGNYREVINAYYMEEKTYEQIAAETGLERKSVESRLYRARNWMKRHWRKEDFE